MVSPLKLMCILAHPDDESMVDGGKNMIFSMGYALATEKTWEIQCRCSRSANEWR